MSQNYRDSVDGAIVVPTAATVNQIGRLYASQDVTANVTFKSGVQINAFPIIKGHHPFWVKSVANASIANALYVTTQSMI